MVSKMKYKLLCIDVDGTLACDDKSISRQNIEALKKADKAGIRIAIASGRTPNSLNEIFKQIAYLEDDGKAILKHTLTKEQLEKAYQVIVENKTYAAFSTPQFSIRNNDVSNSWKKQIEKGSLKADFIIAKDQEDYQNLVFEYAQDIVKISILERDKGKYQKVRKELEELDLYAVAMSDIDYVDVTDKQVTKGSAVKELAKYLSIDVNEVICIGDNENDLEMLEVAGLAVAMKNATKTIREKADVISDFDNNHYGVADVIEKYIL